MTHLTRSVSLLHRVEDDPVMVDNPVLDDDGTTTHNLIACRHFRYADDDIAELPERARHVFIDVGDDAEMGEPDVITVTVEPRDLLNAEPDAVFTTEQRADGKWGWLLKHSNGNTLVAEFSQGYDDEDEAREIGLRVVTGEYVVEAR